MSDEQTTKINAFFHALNQLRVAPRAALLVVARIGAWALNCFGGGARNELPKGIAAGSVGFASFLKLVILIVALGCAGELKCRAQSVPTADQVKAAFIYNFARFVEWPTQAFANSTAPMVIGMLGKSDFRNDLEQIVSGKEINGHPLQFKELGSAAEATSCQILFISDSEKGHLLKILADLNSASVLTVGETDHFVGDGGMIYLYIDDQHRVRFQIDNETAKKAGLTISSKLLSLAASPH